MRRAFPALLLLVVSCAAQPPERAPLPDVEDVVSEPAGCQLAVGEPKGVDVVTVIDGGAAVGLLEEGDIISSIGGVVTTTRPDLTEAMAAYGPGETIDIVYTRDGEEETASVTLTPNPNDESKGMIGVTVQTAFDHVGLEEADDVIRPSPTARPIQIGEELILFDPLDRTWQRTGVSPPGDTRWVSSTTGFYSVAGEDPVELLDLIEGAHVDDDGFRGWSAQRLIGTVGDLILLVVTAEIPDQPGFVNLAVAAFDPRSGGTAWVSPVPNTFGIPVAAFGSPDGTAFLAVGADPESGERAGVVLYDSSGTIRTTGGIDGLGDPIGWFDGVSAAFRTSEGVVSVHDFVSGETTTYDLPQNLYTSVAATVGDGQHLLVTGNRNLILQDLTDPVVSGTLASNCSIGPTGEPGWGL